MYYFVECDWNEFIVFSADALKEEFCVSTTKCEMFFIFTCSNCFKKLIPSRIVCKSIPQIDVEAGKTELWLAKKKKKKKNKAQQNQ